MVDTKKKAVTDEELLIEASEKLELVESFDDLNLNE